MGSGLEAVCVLPMIGGGQTAAIFIEPVPLFSCVYRSVTIPAKQLKVIPIQCHIRISNVQRCQVNPVMYYHTGIVDSIFKAPLA